MAIFKTAYDVTACSGYRLKETNDKLKHAMITSSLHHLDLQINDADEFCIGLVEGGNSSSDVIPYFNHPLFLQDSSSINKHGKDTVLIDVRNFGKWNTPQQKFIVRNEPEYSWNILRGVLNHIWVNGRMEIFRDISTIPVSVYAALISECIARKYALDAGEQAIVAIVAGFYYYSLFTEDNTFDETTLNKIAGNIARTTRIPAAKVFEVITDMKVLHSLEELCEALKAKTNSIRLNDFNVGVLLAVVSGNWFGNNARENLAVGLEHIPTWLMICYAALSEATFKRSVLAKLVDRFAKGGAGGNYVKSIDSVLDKQNVLKKLTNG